MEKVDYEKEFVCGETTISRALYESLPCPICTSPLTDDEMAKLAEQIEYEMSEWYEWRDNGDVSEDKCEEQWWAIMEQLAINFGMKYYED